MELEVGDQTRIVGGKFTTSHRVFHKHVGGVHAFEPPVVVALQTGGRMGASHMGACHMGAC